MSQGFFNKLRNKQKKKEITNQIDLVKKAINYFYQKQKMAQFRETKPKCLNCFGDNTEVVLFDDNLSSLKFKHKCGGKLHISNCSHCDVIPSYIIKTTVLDTEGHFLRTEDLILDCLDDERSLIDEFNNCLKDAISHL